MDGLACGARRARRRPLAHKNKLNYWVVTDSSKSEFEKSRPHMSDFGADVLNKYVHDHAPLCIERRLSQKASCSIDRCAAGGRMGLRHSWRGRYYASQTAELHKMYPNPGGSW